MSVRHDSHWPSDPYKGLGFYQESDAPLFAGRETDVERCAADLAAWRTNLLLLHGPSGGGKSSFLRAGLIPYLEDRPTGIEFARREGDEGAPLLLVRSTGDPLAKLAEALFHFASRTIKIATPDGSAELDLRTALPTPDETDAARFVRHVGDDPATLLTIIRALARILPATLVLIIDQGEEVFTVDVTSTGRNRADLFFRFLRDFITSKVDLKILIALRTEFVGRLEAKISHGRPPNAALAKYYLGDLDDSAIRRAIIRPTERTPRNDLPAPFDVYRFSYAEGVVDGIVKQVDLAVTGKLTAVQIVCEALLSRARQRGGIYETVILKSDLEAVGGVRGAIEKFLDQQIERCAAEAGLSDRAAAREVELWKGILFELVLFQPDGTVTTDLRAAATLREVARNSVLDFDTMTQFLLGARVLRETQVVEVTTGNLIRCFGLGHDTLGLVLRSWKVRSERAALNNPLAEWDENPGSESDSDSEGIALCLSGGGYRAVGYQLGVIWRLYELGMLNKLTRIASTSGASIVAGFLALRWKDLLFLETHSADRFRQSVADPLLAFMSHTIDTGLIVRSLLLPGGANKRFSAEFAEHLFGSTTLADLPDAPVFMFTATNMQSGAIWRFSKDYMGDYRVGIVRAPQLPLATAIAASSAMPPTLSPYILNLDSSTFEPNTGTDIQRGPVATQVQLADGAILDDLALETAWRNFKKVLVSDGSFQTRSDPEPTSGWASQIGRIVDLSQNHFRTFRKRQLFDSFSTGTKRGAYWSIGGYDDQMTANQRFTISGERARELAALPTRLNRLPVRTRHDLVNWGYISCDNSLRTFFDPNTPQIVELPFS